MSRRRVEKVAPGDRHTRRSEHQSLRSPAGRVFAVSRLTMSSPESSSVNCLECQKLLGAYQTTVRAYYKAVAAIRRAAAPAEEIAAARRAYLASEDARTTLEKHVRDHSCASRS
jgi:hypothetical protein